MIQRENLKSRISARKDEEILIDIFRYLHKILTLNQQVPGSSPGRPTNKKKHLSSFSIGAFFFGSMPVL